MPYGHARRKRVNDRITVEWHIASVLTYPLFQHIQLQRALPLLADGDRSGGGGGGALLRASEGLGSPGGHQQVPQTAPQTKHHQQQRVAGLPGEGA